MKMNEMEIKVQISSQEQFNRTFKLCEQLFGSAQSHVMQLDEYFDTPDSALKKQDLVIRIRTINDKCMIALKSPRVKLSEGISNRIELEFLAAEGNAVLAQLTRQGLEARESAEKERWTFVHKEIEIVLDRLPFIGYFIEIEGPNEATILNIVERLQLTDNRVIEKNYGELMLEKFRELGLPLDHIHATFAHEKKALTSV